jgi:hypothetical protein
VLFQMYVMARVRNDDVQNIGAYRQHLSNLGWRQSAAPATDSTVGA